MAYPEMCAECDEMSQQENVIADNSDPAIQAGARAEIERLKKIIITKGGVL